MNTARILAALVVSGFAASSASGQLTSRVSVSSSGSPADASSPRPSISSSGGFVAFGSAAGNLVPGDTNSRQDVFVHERAIGVTTRVSLTSSGAQADDSSGNPSICADGRYVAFGSVATNLVPGDTNAVSDVFLRDRLTGLSTRVSVSSGGAEGNDRSVNAHISEDGRFVVFESLASNLVASDTNGTWDVFLHDSATGTTLCASVALSGLPASGTSWMPAVSSDGHFVAFESHAADVVVGDTNGYTDVFVRDVLAGTTVRVSVGTGGGQASYWSYAPTISADGRRVAFWSEASDLVPGDTNAVADAFVHDLAGVVTRRVSVDSNGVQGDQASKYPLISSDGEVVAFGSAATNLVSGDTNSSWDAFAHELTSGLTTRVSVSSSGVQGDSTSHPTTLSADGRLVGMGSHASNLVPGDNNGFEDAFVRDRLGCSPTLATYCTASTTSIAGCRAAIAGRGVPSLNAPGAFTLTSGKIPGGGNVGIAYFASAGPALLPLGTQGGFVCAAPPVLRSTPAVGGGTQGACDGLLTFTLADLIAQHPNALEPGSTVHTGIWFRDPLAADTFALSDALWFHVCP